MRPADGSVLRGETHLIEQTARDAFAWAEPEPADRWTWWAAARLIFLAGVALWGGIAIAAAFAMEGL